VAFVTAVAQLRRWGVELVDSQVHTDHLARFGAELWPRERYLRRLAELLERPTCSGRWALDPDLAEGER
jgi:leucyl/phenylalanyl-tRNA--protein transferase